MTGKINSQMPVDLKSLGQDAGAIFPARENLSRDAACRSRDVKSTGFPSALTIDASVFTDQLKPEARSGDERIGILKASILVEERRGDIAGEQQVEEREDERSEDERSEDGKKTPRADVCARETFREQKIKRRACVDEPASEDLLARIGPTKLSEMINKEINNSIKEINNSIKDAVQTIVKQCSMEEKRPIPPCMKESEGKSRACRSRVAEEHCEKSPDLSPSDRRTTCPAPRKYSDPRRDSSFPHATTHENTILPPASAKINNEKRNKKHSKPANTVTNTDNRRMTGNVNIYICSEANNNSPDKRKTKSQSSTETSSDTITEQSNSGCASSASSCKLINCIQEKRRKLQAQRLSDPRGSRDRSSDSSEDNVVCDNVVRDDGTTARGICRQVSSESNNKGPANVKLSDGDVECGDAISSTRDDGCCCEGTNSTTDPRRDSSESVVPCTRSFSVFDNAARSPAAVYPSKARAESSNSDASLNYNGDDARSNVCGNEGECSARDAGNRWQRKSIYTDCATYGEGPKECLADDCGYKKIDPAINCNGKLQHCIWRRRVGYKLWQPAEGCRKERVILRRSACTCIAEEEEEDRRADRVENAGRASVCDGATCPERTSVCRETPPQELAATVCGTSFSAAEDRYEETRACKSASRAPAECPSGAAVRVTTFGNSEERPEVTRVCKELVAGESPGDIAVRGTTVLGEPKGPREEVAVSEAALPDSEAARKETICKKISGSNFADRGDVEEVSLNGAEDKLAGRNTNSPSLNMRKENVGNAERAMQLNNKYYGNRDNFAGRKSVGNIKRNGRMEKVVSSDESNTRNTPVRPTRDSTALPKSIYSTIPRNSLNLTSNPKANEISNAHSDQRGSLKFQPPNRPLRNYSQQSSRIAKRSAMRDLASRKNNRTGEKAQGKSKEDEEKHNVPKEVDAQEQQPREPLLYRSIKKLADILKYTREQLKVKRETETEKTELKEKIVDGKRDPGESKAISETEDKIIDEEDRELVEQTAPSFPLADGEISKKIAKPESIVTDFGVPKKDEKTDVPKIDETTRVKPKLFRIIAAKKLHAPTVAAADSEAQEPEAESVRVVTDSRESEVESRESVETITSNRVDREKTFQEETIAREPILEEIQEDTKETEEPIAPKISIAEIKIVATDDIVDIPRDIPDEEKVSKDATDERTQVCALFPDEKQREDHEQFTPCKCVVSEPNNAYLTVKRAKLYVPCPQKKTEEESKKTVLCTSPSSFYSKGCSCLSHRSTQCGNILKECLCNERVDRCAPPQHLKSCLKTSQKFDKPTFCNVSPVKISSHVCLNCCKMKEECVCRKIAFSCQPREECECRCVTRADCSRTADEQRPRDQCGCIFLERNKITKVCNCRKAMICLYCDNPRDKCACRAPIGKCSSCGIPSDVCGCHVDEEDVGRVRKQRNEKPDENRTIRVTSWKPRGEIRRYFTRHLEGFQSCSTEGCRCYEKPNGQRTPEEQLPYQRLNIFSDVMNELQQKISESTCCTRCWRNPCCCGSRASQAKDSEEKNPKGCVRCSEIEKSPGNRPGSKSPNNCRCNSSSKTGRTNAIEKSMPTTRRTCCELSPCRCRGNRTNNKRPLAKCYYCKSLPCA